MSNENIAGPLDLLAVDTSLPLLKDNTVYDLIIQDASVVPTKHPGVEMIKIDMVNSDPAQSMKDEPISAQACHVFTNLVLAPSGKATWDMVTRNAANFLKSVRPLPTEIRQFGNTVQSQLAAAKQWVGMLKGRKVRAKVTYVPEGVTPAGKSYKAKNEVSFYVENW